MASTDFYAGRLIESAYATPEWVKSEPDPPPLSSSVFDCAGDRYQLGGGAQNGEGKGETRILVADDHEQIRDSISRMLSRTMNVVGIASNGEEAVEMAKRHVPQLILMDIRMPVMDGITATRLIHKDQPWIRIIGHSAYNDRELMAEMIDAGAELFVLKGSEDLVPFLASL